MPTFPRKTDLCFPRRLSFLASSFTFQFGRFALLFQPDDPRGVVDIGLEFTGP